MDTPCNTAGCLRCSPWTAFATVVVTMCLSGKGWIREGFDLMAYVPFWLKASFSFYGPGLKWGSGQFFNKPRARRWRHRSSLGTDRVGGCHLLDRGWDWHLGFSLGQAKRESIRPAFSEPLDSTGDSGPPLHPSKKGHFTCFQKPGRELLAQQRGPKAKSSQAA